MAACQHFLLRRSGAPGQPGRKRFIHTNKPKSVSFGILLGIYQASGKTLQLRDVFSFCSCDDIMNGFAAGQERVKVIVNLAEPAKEKAKTDWSSRRSLALLQDKIKALQAPVLSVLGPQEFNLRYRFENQAGFSGEVTSAGLEKLKNDPRVVSIEPDIKLELHLRQGIPLMKADTYRSTYNGAGIAIAICDTGIDYHHPMLGGGGFPNSKVIGGYDFGDGDSDPMPSDPHGTCCAGIAAGNLGNTGDYIGGVAYNAKLYALKVMDSSGYIYNSYVIAAWNWCVTHKNDNPANPIMVISNSFGGGRYYSTCDTAQPSMTTAASSAVAAGITVLVSSGNDGYCDSIANPACISSVISVGAVYDATLGSIGFCIDPASCGGENYPSCTSTSWACFNSSAADMVTCYSNTASFLNLLAPSHNAYTTDIVGLSGYSLGDYYDSFGGTSAACPYAAGAVACLQSAAKAIRGSYLSPSQVRTILTSTGNNITDGKVLITKPRINLEQAINNLLISGPPIANDIDVVTTLNTAITIALQATDDGLPNPPGDLNYIITSLPTHGDLNDPNVGIIGSVPHTLAGNGSQVIYTPATGYTGPDNFIFKANDGGVPPDGGDSNTATVSITVNPARSTILFENFESGIGGFTINNAFGDGSGLWHLTTACNSPLSGHSTPTSLYYGQNSDCNYDAGKTEGVVTCNFIRYQSGRRLCGLIRIQIYAPNRAISEI
ncbi:MAG: S8 family serine peptidase [Sedimentisphaerales bacterium]